MESSSLTEKVNELINFETEMARTFARGEVRGPAHFVRGNEEQLIKIFGGLDVSCCIKTSHIRKHPGEYLVENKLIEIPEEIEENNPIFKGIQKNDWLFLSYRNHYHLYLRGIPKEVIKQGILEGRSMHPLNKDYRIVTSAIVPGQIPVAVGYASALKRREITSEHVWAFCGDMGAETGIYEECTKYAAGHDLPITFVVEDNGISCETPTIPVWGNRQILSRPLRKNEIRYSYENTFPHQGVGREAGF